MITAKQIIQDMTFDDPLKKKIFLDFAEKWESGFPTTLYLSHYELAHGTDPEQTDFEHPGFGGDAQLWKEFLSIPEIVRYQTAQIGEETEVAARKALKVMLKKGLDNNSGAVSALKEVINSSKLLQQSMKKRETVVLTYVSPKEYDDSEAENSESDDQ